MRKNLVIIGAMGVLQIAAFLGAVDEDGGLCLGSTMSGVTKRTVESCLLRVESSEGFRRLTLAPAFESVRRTSSGRWPPSPQSGEGISPVDVERAERTPGLPLGTLISASPHRHRFLRRSSSRGRFQALNQ
jgi:hypothetical protein